MHYTGLMCDESQSDGDVFRNAKTETTMNHVHQHDRIPRLRTKLVKFIFLLLRKSELTTGSRAEPWRAGGSGSRVGGPCGGQRALAPARRNQKI